MEVTNTDNTELEIHLRKLVNMDKANEAHRNQLLSTLEHFQTSWNGSLGKVNGLNTGSK